MATLIPTSYGHHLTVEQTGDGVRIVISPSPHMDGYTPHLDAEQAFWLAAALPGETTVVEQVPNERGFYGYPEVLTVDGWVVRPQESSAATGPHLWIFQGRGGDVPERSEFVLDASGAAALKSAICTWHSDIPNRWDLED